MILPQVNDVGRDPACLKHDDEEERAFSFGYTSSYRQNNEIAGEQYDKDDTVKYSLTPQINGLIRVCTCYFTKVPTNLTSNECYNLN